MDGRPPPAGRCGRPTTHLQTVKRPGISAWSWHQSAGPAVPLVESGSCTARPGRSLLLSPSVARQGRPCTAVADPGIKAYSTRVDGHWSSCGGPSMGDGVTTVLYRAAHALAGYRLQGRVSVVCCYGGGREGDMIFLRAAEHCCSRSPC